MRCRRFDTLAGRDRRGTRGVMGRMGVGRWRAGLRRTGRRSRHHPGAHVREHRGHHLVHEGHAALVWGPHYPARHGTHHPRSRVRVRAHHARVRVSLWARHPGAHVREHRGHHLVHEGHAALVGPPSSRPTWDPSSPEPGPGPSCPGPRGPVGPSSRRPCARPSRPTSRPCRSGTTRQRPHPDRGTDPVPAPVPSGHPSTGLQPTSWRPSPLSSFSSSSPSWSSGHRRPGPSSGRAGGDHQVGYMLGTWSGAR